MAGLRLTLPPGWQSPEANTANVVLHPPGHPQQRLILFGGVSAVKSTGPGHGTTVLSQVGQTPEALVKWMTTDPDFTVVAQPSKVTIGPDISAVALTVGVSTTARYADPGCPANPRCADLFALGGDFYGIGGQEQVRLYLAKTAAYPDAAFIVALEAPNHRALTQLTELAAPVINSMHRIRRLIARAPRWRAAPGVRRARDSGIFDLHEVHARVFRREPVRPLSGCPSAPPARPGSRSRPPTPHRSATRRRA